MQILSYLVLHEILHMKECLDFKVLVLLKQTHEEIVHECPQDWKSRNNGSGLGLTTEWKACLAP